MTSRSARPVPEPRIPGPHAHHVAIVGRVAAFAFLAATPLAAQFQLYVVEDSVWQPIQNVVNFGSIPTGAYKELSFRLQNVTSTTAQLDRLKLEKSPSDPANPFKLIGVPSLVPPLLLEPNKVQAFRIRFEPTSYGTYSGRLMFTGGEVMLVGEALPAVSIYLEENGQRRPLGGDNPGVSFGMVDRLQTAARTLILANGTIGKLTVSSVSVDDGEGFSVRNLPALPFALAPNQSVTFEVAFSSAQPGIHQGTLAVDGQAVPLDAYVRTPVLPKPVLQVEPATLASGQQARVSIQFSAPATVDETGELTLGLTPDPSITNPDSAVLFTASGLQSIKFTIKEGETVARFGEQTAAVFQTGTTAGTLLLTAKVQSHQEELRLNIAPARVGLSSVAARRTVRGIEASITGFDNARTSSSISFRFLDAAGNSLTPSPIASEVVQPFREYFAASDAGGAFLLKAAFVITGDASVIRAVDIEMANSAGTAQAPRVMIQE